MQDSDSSPSVRQQGKPWLLCLFIIALALLSASSHSFLSGADHIDRSLERSLMAFGIARGLNAVISLAQSTTLALQPVGVGLSFSPGELLDPFNDLIERFSVVMLLASASLGIQKIILSIVETTHFRLTVSALLILSAGALLLTPAGRANLKGHIYKVILVMVVARFGIGSLATANEGIFTFFLAQDYEAAAAILETGRDELDDLNNALSRPPASTEDQGLFNRGKKALKALLDLEAHTKAIEAHIEKYKAVINEATRATIKLVALFIFQTAVLPIVFLLLLKIVFQNLWRLF